MNNPAVQQALIELQESLSNIESARKQVNNVAEKSEQLIKSFNNVYDAITSVDKNLVIDEKAIKNQLNESFKFFNAGLSEIVKESNQSVSGLQASLSSYENKISKLLNTSIENTDARLNDFVSKLTSNITDKNKQLTTATAKVLDSISSINTTISIDKELVARQLNDNFKYFQSSLDKIVKESEKGIRELEKSHAIQESKFADSLNSTFNLTEKKIDQSVTAIEEKSNSFMEALQRANEQVRNFEGSVKAFDGRIQEIDFANDLKRIERKIDNYQKQNLVIGLVIVLGLITLALLKK